jgi:transcriptional regulator with XRE-family HTH domain
LRITFGINFKAARIKAGLTQTDITGLTGIAQTYISSIECGKQNPTLDTLAALAEAIGSDVRTLLKQLPPPATSRKRSPR